MLFWKSKKEKELEAETKRCLEESDKVIAVARKNLENADTRSISEKLSSFAKKF
jgi:hypothetical protein